jgi:DNA-binding CsgD family transcriptional regulator
LGWANVNYSAIRGSFCHDLNRSISRRRDHVFSLRGTKELGMNLYLVCRDRHLVQRPLPLAAGSRYVIGRALECEVYVKDRSISRQHAELSLEGRQIKVRDLGSLNGTFLGDERVTEGVLLPGQSVRFGRVRFTVTEDPHRDPAPSEPGHDDSTALEQFDQRRNILLQKLSEAQRRVTILLLGGRSEKEAATRLRLSQHTVHNHIKEIYRRLGVNSRAELLALFVDDEFNEE